MRGGKGGVQEKLAALRPKGRPFGLKRGKNLILRGDSFPPKGKKCFLAGRELLAILSQKPDPPVVMRKNLYSWESNVQRATALLPSTGGGANESKGGYDLSKAGRLACGNQLCARWEKEVCGNMGKTKVSGKSSASLICDRSPTRKTPRTGGGK